MIFCFILLCVCISMPFFELNISTCIFCMLCNIRVEEEPSEARVWVVSSGTENTVFSWSVWRRLPLHEVSVYKLISLPIAIFSHPHMHKSFHFIPTNHPKSIYNIQSIGARIQ